ncbi:hypothetical protein ACRAWF_20585 [Streptomyces sp. L7]
MTSLPNAPHPTTKASRAVRVGNTSRLLRLVAGAAVGALTGLAVGQSAPPATAAPATTSVTVSGRGEFKDMQIHRRPGRPTSPARR